MPFAMRDKKTSHLRLKNWFFFLFNTFGSFVGFACFFMIENRLLLMNFCTLSFCLALLRSIVRSLAQFPISLSGTLLCFEFCSLKINYTRDLNSHARKNFVFLLFCSFLLCNCILTCIHFVVSSASNRPPCVLKYTRYTMLYWKNEMMMITRIYNIILHIYAIADILYKKYNCFYSDVCHGPPHFTMITFHRR